MKQSSEVIVPSDHEPSEPASTIGRRPTKLKGAITEYSVFFVVSLICFNAGFVKHLTMSNLDYSEVDGKDGKENTKEFHYLTQLDMVPSAIGIVWSLLLAIIVSFYGRKPALYAAAVFGIFSGFMFIYSENDDVLCIFVARAFASAVETAAYMVCPLYMIEMVHDATRGIFTAGCSFLVFGGMALAFVLAETIPYTLFCSCLVILPTTFMFLFFWIPESPYFLAFKAKMVEAERSLLWMRRQDPELIKPELADIVEIVKSPSDGQACCSLKSDATVGMATSLSLYILKSTGGISATIHICDFVCADEVLTATDLQGTMVSLKLLSSFLSTLAVDRAGRKIMLYISYGGSFITFLIITICLSEEPGSYSRSIVTICICVFAIFYGLGYGTITHLVALELTPVPSRCKMIAIAYVLDSILSICMMVSHEPINLVLGPPFYYIIPTIGNALGILFVWMVVPETCHKSLKGIQEIQSSQE